MDKNTRKEPTSIFPTAVVHNVMLQKENCDRKILHSLQSAHTHSC